MKKSFMEYLKSFEINSKNKHKEKEFEDYIVSTVMITNEISTSNNTDTKYEVYLLIQDKKTDKFYNNILIQEFNNKEKANEYYGKLYLDVLDMNNHDITGFLK